MPRDIRRSTFSGVAGGGGTNVYPLPDQVVINAPFKNSLIPILGTTPSFSRGSDSTYGLSNSLLGTKVTDAALIPEYGFGEVESGGGLGIYSKGKNWILASEDFGDTGYWGGVGGGSATSNVGTDPFGTTLAASITGADPGDGIEQDSGITSSGASFLFSVYLKTSSGTADVELTLSDGNVLFGTVTCRVTTTWKRFEVFKTFTSGGFTTVCRIAVGATVNVLAFGAMLETVMDTAAYDISRMEGASPYIKTTSAVATRDNDILTFAASDVDQCQPKGSISFWIKTLYDPSQFGSGGTSYLFSISGEDFAFISDRGVLLKLFLGGGFVGASAGGVGIGRNTWTRVGLTWDTTADEYKIYINRVLVKTLSTASAPWTTGQPFYLGARSSLTNHWYSSGRYRNFVMWKDTLSEAQMGEAYDVDSAELAEPTLSTGKLFEVALGTSLIPSTGNTPYRYTRRGIQRYYTSTSAISAITDIPDGMPATPAYALNAPTSKAGMAFTLNRINSILRSESIGSTWTVVGTGTRTSIGGTMLGSLNYGTLAATAANYGIQQSISTAAASTEWVGSVYVQRDGGSDVTGVLTIEGDSGGTPETSTLAFTAGATPTRIYLKKVFTGSATGNVRLKLTVDGAGTTMRVAGFQLERRNTDPTLTPNLEYPSTYVRTVASAQNGYLTQLCYEAKGNINPAKGTIILWVNHFHDEAATSTGNTPTYIGFPGHTTGFIFRTLQGGNLTFQYGLQGINPVTLQESITFSAFQWVQLGCSWDVASGTVKLYKDGAVIDSSTGNTMTAVQLFKMYIGTDELIGSTDTHEGLIDKVMIKGELDDNFVSDDWTNFKASYGR